MWRVVSTMFEKKLIFLTIGILVKIECAKILGIIPMPSYSHQVAFQPLWKELSLRGHQVTVLTTNPMKDPTLINLTEIDLSSSYKVMDKNLVEIINNHDNFYKMLNLAISSLNQVVEHQLSNREVQKLIKDENEHFDLLIVEYIIPVMTAFSERFKCPYIGVVSVDPHRLPYKIMGNPAHPMLNPEFNLPFVGDLNFVERLISAASMVIGEILSRWYVNPMEAMVKKYFGDEYPSLAELYKNISMLFVNTDPIFHSIRPLVPAVIQIGAGVHRQPPKPLPEDLKKCLDNATEGFIYFSLGSTVKSKYLSEKTRNVILEAFSELPYRVLWKFELDELPGKPANVLVSKWFPQQDILKHPNIKLFITQGGIQSIDEAIYDHVPMLGLPFFMDQPANIKRMVHKGIGLSLDYKSLDKETFKATILEIINNPKYRYRLRELTALAQDQPMTGLQKAVWWTEYVIRHKGAKHLRNHVLDLPIYQYFLLDVIGFCLLVVLIVGFVIIKLCKSFGKLISRSNGNLKTKID